MGLEMTPETRMKNACIALGWQGGTVHDVCAEIGLDPYDFLYGAAEIDYVDGSVSKAFKQGYFEARNAKDNTKKRAGDLQYWLGVVSAVANDYEFIS